MSRGVYPGPHKGGVVAIDPIVRFDRHVDKNGPLPLICPELGRCWQWMAGVSQAGYGRFGIKVDGHWVQVQAHRFAMGLGPGLPGAGIESDHICGNKRCVNQLHLRTANHSENNQNKGKTKNNKSGYKGVSWHTGAKKWRATIFLNKKQIHLGFYSEKTDAFSAYKEAAITIHGKFANFGESHV